MRNGKLKVGKYDIEPTTSVDTFPSDEYNIINIKNGIVYISKNPFEISGSKFWVTIYFEKKYIKKVELNNADEKYKMNYQTMDSTLLEKLRKENDEFLLNNLGSSKKENLSGLEYEYPWGKVMSYFDIKSAEAGIAICYFWVIASWSGETTAYSIEKFFQIKTGYAITIWIGRGYVGSYMEQLR